MEHIETVRLERAREKMNRLCIVPSTAIRIERKVMVAIEALKEVNRTINEVLDDDALELTESEYKRLQKVIYSEVTPLLKRLI